MIAVHAIDFVALGVSTVIFAVPWIVGFTFVRADANQRGQPGWLWATP